MAAAVAVLARLLSGVRHVAGHAAGGYSSWYAAAPFVATSCACMVKGCLSDLTSQRIEYSLQEDELRRLKAARAAGAAPTKTSPRSETALTAGTSGSPQPGPPNAAANSSRSQQQLQSGDGTELRSLPSDRSRPDQASRANVGPTSSRGGTPTEPATTDAMPAFWATIHIKRTLVFSGYSAFYCGAFQELVYNRLYPRWFGDGSGLAGRALLRHGLKVLAFEQLVHVPFLVMPVYFIIHGIAFGGTAWDGLCQYGREWQETLGAYYAIWTLPQIVNFTLVPAKWKILYIACFSYISLVVLSYLSHRHLRE